MSKRIFLALSDEQYEALDKLMTQDLQTNLTAFIVYLIAQETKNRTRPKATLGRPKKDSEPEDEEPVEPEDDYKDDLPKNIPYFGEMIGPRESADKKALQDAFTNIK